MVMKSSKLGQTGETKHGAGSLVRGNTGERAHAREVINIPSMQCTSQYQCNQGKKQRSKSKKSLARETHRRVH
jgi:hypothetical protein